MNIWPGFSIRTSLNKERAGRREAILLVSGVLLLVLAALAGGLLCWAKKLQARRHKPLVETFHNR